MTLDFFLPELLPVWFLFYFLTKALVSNRFILQDIDLLTLTKQDNIIPEVVVCLKLLS